MRYKILFIYGLIFFALAAVSCTAQRAAPEEKLAAALQEPGSAMKQGWEKEWEALVREARKEGRVFVASSGGTETRDAIAGPLRQKFGIELEWLTSPSSALVAKINTERSANLFLFDMLISGPDTAYDNLRPKGAIVPLDKWLLLPEVKDPSAWLGGKVLFYDEEHTIVAMTATPTGQLSINTVLVRPGEFKSLQDLLDSRWKGKIVMHSPRGGGSGRRWAGVYADVLGYDFLRQLVKQEPVLVADHRIGAEWIARGKYAIGIALRSEDVRPFMEAGSPVAQVLPLEGGYLASSGGNVMVMDRAPHANATRVFLNWVLSREGQTYWSRGSTDHTARVDIKPEELGIPASNIRQPGAKYLYTLTRESSPVKHEKELSEIFAPLLR